jgi:hypothetical protein
MRPSDHPTDDVTVFRRHRLWLLPQFSLGALLIGAGAVPLFSPLIQHWQVRLGFAAVELAALLWWGLHPLLSWQRFRLTLTPHAIVVEELVGMRIVVTEHSRHSARVTRRSTLWPLLSEPITLTVETTFGSARYPLLVRM